MDPLRFPCIFTDEDENSTVKLKKIESFSETLWSTGHYNAGKGLLELRTKYPFFHHLVYSLLKGRTVVVTGGPLRMMFVYFY